MFRGFLRLPSTRRDGRSFSEEEKRAVWNKAQLVVGYNPAFVRMDICGNLIEWKDYGNRNSRYGWEVDHILAVASGGGDEFSNLQPLQWENNVSKGDGPAYGYCKIG